MPVRVEQVTKTKSGKALRVLLGGTWYGAFLDSGLDRQVGNMVEAEIVTQDKYGPTITGWKPVAAPQVSSPLPQPVTAVPAVAAPITREPVYAEQNKNVAPYWLPMVSNVVAHAIAAGHINNPTGIKAWVDATRVAIIGAVNDSDVPF